MDHLETKYPIETIRHSSAHILAQAILRLYPNTRLGIGPATNTGFYYDAEIEAQLTPEVLSALEEEMKRIVDEDLQFKQIFVSREQAFDTLHQLGQVYKTELLQQIGDEQISFFKTGEEFIDLCRGPHVHSTSEVQHFKLTQISSHHWLNNPQRPKLTRIEGVAFLSKNQLDEYFQLNEELAQNQHPNLARKLKLYLVSEQKQSQYLTWMKKGIEVYDQINNHINRTLINNNYNQIQASTVIRGQAKYRSNIYKPFIDYFKSDKRSYRSLPLRVFETVSIENQPVKQKKLDLINTSQFKATHNFVFIDPENTFEDVTECLRQILTFYTRLGFSKNKIVLNQPEILEDSSKIQLNNFFLDLAKHKQLPIKVEISSETTRPYLSIFVRDKFDREWEVSSLKILSQITVKNNIGFINNKGKLLRPLIIHFELVNSLEKLIALLLEESGGAFPLWLSPVQILVIPISQKYNQHALRLGETLKKNNIRTHIDKRDESMQTKIREGELSMVPYMIIIGEKELRTGSLSIRPRSGKDLGLIKIADFLKLIETELTSDPKQQS